jgi:drug/metabolite transporter (DMT)-like permease
MKTLINKFYNMPSLLLITATLCWAFNTIFGQLAVGEISPLHIVPLRWLFVSTFLWVTYGNQVKSKWNLIQPQIIKIIFMTFMGFSGFNLLFYTAAHETTAINIGILQGAMPIFVILGAYMSYGTKINLIQGLGVSISLVGVIIITLSGDINSLLELEINRGDLLMLIACFMYSYYTIALKSRIQISAIAFFTLLSVIAMFIALPLFIVEFVISGMSYPTTEGWVITLLIAVFPSCVAQICHLRGVDLAGPGKAAVYTNIVPIFSSFLAIFLLNQSFEIYHGLALSLVIIGIWLAQKETKNLPS